MEIDVLGILRSTPELALFVILGLGYLLGNAGWGAVRPGTVTGVLLVGLVFGYLELAPASSRAGSVGFMLFIYSVGLQAGPRFFSVVLEDGTRYLALVAVTAGTALATLLLVAPLLDLSPGLAAGMLAGALTSTPTLAAAQDAVASGLARPPAGVSVESMLEDVTVGYAISYLFGTIGLLAIVRLVPALLRVDLAKSAAEQSRYMRLPEGEEEDGGRSERWQPLVRAYEVGSGPLAGQRLRELALPSRYGCIVQKIRRGEELIAPGPDVELRSDDRILVMGEIAAQQRLAEQAGPMVLDADLLDLPIREQEVVVTSGSAAGRSFRELDLIHRFGCYVGGVSRAQVELPVTPDLTVEKGDTLYAYGTRQGLEALAAELGHTEKKVYETDLLTFALGIAAGLFIGTIRVKVGNIDIGLGSAGGLLLSGITVGFLRSIHPTFGRVPRAARWVLMEFGLMVFMAGVGVRAGPSFFSTLADVGPWMIAGALLVLIAPFTVGIVFGRLVLGMNPALLLGAMTGALTSTPALGLVNQQARSSVPALGYAGTYAFANIVLAFAGAAVVRL
jgi:putative transport protein